MKVSHAFGERKVESHIDEEVGFLITNKKGGFTNLGIRSRYRGVFFKLGNDVIKVVDDIRTHHPLTELRNNYWHTVRCSRTLCEFFFMPFGTNSLVYELSKPRAADVLFDVKHAYDNREWGRNYQMSMERGMAILTFTKKTDSREDSSHDQEEYTLYAAVKGDKDSKLTLIDEWEEQYYSFDASRGSHPNNRHVFKGLQMKGKSFVLSCSTDKHEAMRECDRIHTHLSKLKALQKQYSRVSIRQSKNVKLSLAEKCAIESLDNLLVDQNKQGGMNVYAGLPWFFQFWGRDTLISLKALMLDREYDTAKHILVGMLDHITEDGLLPNRIPSTVTSSADAIGWYFKRWGDLFDILRSDKQLGNYFSKAEITRITKKLEDCVNAVFKKHTRDSMAINQSQETWMDTNANEGGRAGACIEIQALRLCMYDLLYRLTDKGIYKDMRDRLAAKVRSVFWNGTYLKDTATDDTIRVNLFIAAYLYPDLLKDKEWITCFEHVLPKLWLHWGGLSTIDKDHHLYHADNTGEDIASYHQGDSWYWINNLAAIVLHRLDASPFNTYIDAIVAASSNDILYKGFIGCHSEISSASEQRAQGCLSQAWSNALFVELIEEMRQKK